MRTRSWIAYTLPVLFLMGCGGSSRNAAPVSGRVTLNGQPVADVVVRFQPVGTGDVEKRDAGVGSHGKTDADGRFTLRFSDDDSSGAIIGDHTVVIDELTPPEEENNDAGGIGRAPVKSRIPAKWANGSQKYTVREGTNEASFELND